MLEIIKMIVDLLGKFINPSEILKLRREKQIGDLGAELFLLYVNLNEILIAGEHMIDSWKYYLNRIDRRKGYGYDTYTMSRSWALDRSRELHEQFQRIKKLSDGLSRCSAQLQILNAEAYLKISVLLFGWRKISLLRDLEGILRKGSMPLLSADMLNDALEILLRLDRDPNRNDENSLINTMEKSCKEIIPLSDPSIWDSSVYKKIESYLNSGEPRQQLDEIRAVLQQLYSTLKDNFSIQDILLEVGDRRLSKTN